MNPCVALSPPAGWRARFCIAALSIILPHPSLEFRSSVGWWWHWDRALTCLTLKMNPGICLRSISRMPARLRSQAGAHARAPAGSAPAAGCRRCCCHLLPGGAKRAGAALAGGRSARAARQCWRLAKLLRLLRWDSDVVWSAPEPLAHCPALLAARCRQGKSDLGQAPAAATLPLD